MDGLHFDRVVKSLVARGPRRSVLGALSGVALAPIAALRAPHRALAVGGSCTAEAAAACTVRGFSCCNNHCVCATCDQNCPPGVGCICGSCPNVCAPCSACVDLEHGGSCYIGDVEDPCAGNCRPGLSHCRGHCVESRPIWGFAARATPSACMAASMAFAPALLAPSPTAGRWSPAMASAATTGNPAAMGSARPD